MTIDDLKIAIEKNDPFLFDKTLMYLDVFYGKTIIKVSKKEFEILSNWGSCNFKYDSYENGVYNIDLKNNTFEYKGHQGVIV